MNTLNLNFAERPFQNWHVWTTLFGVVGGLLVLGSLLHMWFFFSVRSNTLENRTRVEEVQARIQTALDAIAHYESMLSVSEIEALNEQTYYVNSLVTERLFSWTILMDDLEAVLPPRVYLHTIIPNQKDGLMSIQLSTVSKSPDDLIEFLNRLEASDRFARAFPGGEREEMRRTLGRGILSRIQVDYLPEPLAPLPQSPDGTAPLAGDPLPGEPGPESQAPEDPESQNPASETSAEEAVLGTPPTADGLQDKVTRSLDTWFQDHPRMPRFKSLEIDFSSSVPVLGLEYSENTWMDMPPARKKNILSSLGRIFNNQVRLNGYPFGDVFAVTPDGQPLGQFTGEDSLMEILL